MTNFLLRRFVPDYQNTADPAVREKYGNLAGIVGIICNVLLFAGKLLAGTLCGSVSVTADAVNNLSDASSSLVTLLGFQLAGKKPDPQHPFGHGRIEYISGLVVSGLILLMGVELGKSSVEKILHPEAVEFSVLTAAVLTGSILPGITRKSCIELLKSWGVPVEERLLSVDELFEAAKNGTLEEAWCVGTAAVISPIGELAWNEETFEVNQNRIGALSQRLYDELTGIQWGTRPDPFGWTCVV